MILTRDFYERDTLTVAKDLLGKNIVRRTDEGIIKGMIVETEAYLGKIDDAAHSYKGSFERVRVQYGPAGHAYVYLIYGMYCCMNITTGPIGDPEVVLIRAVEPVSGIDLMKTRRKTEKLKNLCSGPGKLCKAFDITRDLYGADLCCEASGIWLETNLDNVSCIASKRINIDYAEKCKDKLWRFTVEGNPYVSV